MGDTVAGVPSAGTVPGSAFDPGESEDPRVIEAWGVLAQAQASGDHQAVYEAANVLANVLEDLNRIDDARRVGKLAGVAQLWLTQRPGLGSEDPAVRADAWWQIGAALHWHEHDIPGALDAYRQVIAAGGPTRITLVATMNLAQLLEEIGDVAGAQGAYGQVLELIPQLPPNDTLRDLNLSKIVAQGLARLERDGPENGGPGAAPYGTAR